MQIKKVGYNILTSGTYDTYEISMKSRVIFLNTVMIVGFITLLLFSGLSFYQQNLFLAIPTAATAALLVIGFVYIRLTKNFQTGDYIASLVNFVLFTYLYFSGGLDGSGVLWLFSFPLIALFLHQVKMGTFLSALMLAVILSGLFIPGIGAHQYSIAYGLRIIGTYIFIYLFSLIYEIVRNKTLSNLSEVNSNLNRTAHELNQEKVQTDAVLANVQEGIFLLNSDFIVEPSYSKHLTTLFETDEITGKKLTDLIGPYLSQKNEEALKDYLPMLLDETMNPELIRDINPLEQIRFAIPLSGDAVKEKTLEFSFSTINIEGKNKHILSVVRDVSEQVELSAQMEAEQHKHQRNMETLFQVLHVEPELMAEFIEDSELELESINTMLKDQDLGIPETLLQMFQVIHGIKGNALLLGLEEMAITLHNLEKEIQDSIEIKSVTWKDILPLTASIGFIQQAFEETRGIIQKLMSFQHASNLAGLNKTGMLERAIRRIVDRESLETGRTAQIAFRNLDILPDYARRQTRDILVQCVRNSFAHGLDSETERALYKKSPDFQIHVLVNDVGDSISITYQDDGKGIDIEKVRDRAASLPSLQSTNIAEMSDSDLIRLLFHPGLSTSNEESLSAGRGIGMSLVHTRIKELNGRIKISNNPTLGMKLSLIFPKTEVLAIQSA
ncbi:ATP-binding protein [Spirochaeta dissipatitropha]